MQPTDQTAIPFARGRIGSWQWQLSRTPLDRDELSRRYDRMAPRWGRLVGRLGYDRAYRELFATFFDEHAIDPATAALKVLDCGVGTGSYSRAFADASPVRVSIDAIDISSEMVSAASKRFAEKNIDARVQCADIQQLPFADQTFDVVLAAHVLEHLPNAVAALEEIRRVLKPGGWLITSITRSSMLGTYVQAKWRTHGVSASTGRAWLAQAGFAPTGLGREPKGTYSRTSLTYLGQKPMGAVTEREHT